MIRLPAMLSLLQIIQAVAAAVAAEEGKRVWPMPTTIRRRPKPPVINCVAIINDLDDTIYTVMEYINYGHMQMATTL